MNKIIKTLVLGIPALVAGNISVRAEEPEVKWPEASKITSTEKTDYKNLFEAYVRLDGEAGKEKSQLLGTAELMIKPGRFRAAIGGQGNLERDNYDEGDQDVKGGRGAGRVGFYLFADKEGQLYIEANGGFEKTNITLDDVTVDTSLPFAGARVGVAYQPTGTKVELNGSAGQGTYDAEIFNNSLDGKLTRFYISAKARQRVWKEGDKTILEESFGNSEETGAEKSINVEASAYHQIDKYADLLTATTTGAKIGAFYEHDGRDSQGNGLIFRLGPEFEAKWGRSRVDGGDSSNSDVYTARLKAELEVNSWVRFYVGAGAEKTRDGVGPELKGGIVLRFK